MIVGVVGLCVVVIVIGVGVVVDVLLFVLSVLIIV